MTEAEWSVCESPSVMLKAIESYERLRKLRLVACACYRHANLSSPHNSDLRAIESIERYIDGVDSLNELIRHIRNARDVAACFRCLSPSVQILAQIMETVIEGVLDRDAERKYQCQAVLDVFAYRFYQPPLRPEAIAPLAERIYAGEWKLMPILGEWLQENGYWSEGEHCLDPKIQHVKGCWVVDWVTGRE